MAHAAKSHSGRHPGDDPGGRVGPASVPDIPKRYFLAGRGLAEIRRAALGMQLRLTPAGIDLADEREREVAGAAAEIDWAGINCGLAG